MSEFYSIKIADIHQETNDTVSIALDIPQALQSDFKYKSGQYITLKVNLNGEELRRSYSLSSAPVVDTEHRIAVKKIENGKVSTFLNQEVTVADQLEVSAPEGNFYYQSNGAPQSIILFAAGSGITPIISILKAALADNEQSRVLLFYGNRNEDTIIYKSQLQALKATYGDRLSLVNVFSQPKGQHEELLTGRIEGKKVLALLRRYADLSITNEYFICGPSAMMQSIESSLETVRVDKENIHVEYFTAPAEGESEKEIAFDGDAQATFIVDGDEIEVTIEKGSTILDAALQNNIDAPYSCRGAVCSSCIAQLDEGTAEMRMNYVLSDAEIADNLVLTCQACPTSSKIVVNYDEA